MKTKLKIIIFLKMLGYKQNRYKFTGPKNYRSKKLNFVEFYRLRHFYNFGVEYSGTAAVNVVVGNNFTVSFSSDDSVTDTGFVLGWSCEIPRQQSCKIECPRKFKTNKY